MINTSSYKPSTNSMAEMQCKLIIRSLRAHCEKLVDWPSHLTSIQMAHKATIVSSIGVSPFFAMFGVNMRLSFEWDYFHPDKECPQKQLQIALDYASKLEVMRKVLQENVKDCHKQTEAKYNKTAKPQEFTEGMRVYMKVDHHKPGESPKHRELYTGPFQILQVKISVLVKLQHLYTEKLIKN